MRMIAFIASVLVLLFAVVFLQHPAEGPPRMNGAGAIRLRVMSFNIREGGAHGQFPAVIAAIEQGAADVVGLQEPFGSTRRIAAALGWYAAPSLHTISRFPILQPQGSRGRYGWLLVGRGRVVTIANVHNPASPYGPTLVLNARPLEQVLDNERKVRLPWMRPFLRALEPIMATGEPVFFTGDFNSPSWRDWTPAVVDAIGWQPPTVVHRGPRYAVQWPATLEMEAAGFRDSYREEHPDPVTAPGYTWTPGHPKVGARDVFDRIDFVWAAGWSRTIGSQIVGDADEVTDVVVEPWPSDHRAVVSSFRVRPSDAPTFAAPIDPRMMTGAPVPVVFHADRGTGRVVGLWPRGTDPLAATPAASMTLDDVTRDGRRNLDTTGVEPGNYDLSLVVDRAVRSHVPVTVVDPGAEAEIETSAEIYSPGDPIVASWTNAPGNRYDWLSVNRTGISPAVGRNWEWRYTDARINGSASIRANAEGPWPLPPGRYQVHLCVDDDDTCIATSTSFRVAGPSQP
jgi:endonuclease/exonuclease/phosphatase family metal-dependent hydrolase